MRQMPAKCGAIVLLSLVIMLSTSPATAQRKIQVRSQRQFTLKNLSGDVQFKPLRRPWRRARPNQPISKVGEQIRTGKRSSARLQLDVGIGSIQVSPSTLLQLRQISLAPDQSRISIFYVPYGRARLKLRRFTNPNTRFDIETPAGISGVRGTEFGIAVQPNGKTSVAVLEGRVNTSAQGEAVDVNSGFQNFTIPGEPPSPPVPLNENVSLDYELEKTIVRQVRKLSLLGQVDPVNVVSVNGKVVNTDRNGKFRVPVRLRSFPRLQVNVQTPLGKSADYDLRLLR